MTQRKSKATKVDKNTRGTKAVRIPLALYNSFRDIAKRETREIGGQITVALREWLALQDGTDSEREDAPPLTQIVRAATRKVQGSSGPPEHLARLADAKRRQQPNSTPFPPEVLEEIMSDDDTGVEGTSLNVLKGTKGTGAV